MKKILLLMTALVIGLTSCGVEEPVCTQKFIEGKLVTIDEKEYVGTFFDFTNSGAETVIPADEIEVKAFQNGEELNVVVYTGQEVEGALQCDSSIQSGTTTEIVWTFEAQDNSTVSLECSDGQNYTFDIQ